MLLELLCKMTNGENTNYTYLLRTFYNGLDKNNTKNILYARCGKQLNNQVSVYNIEENFIYLKKKHQIIFEIGSRLFVAWYNICC